MDFHNPVSSYSHLFAALWMVFVGLYLLRLAACHSIGRRIGLLLFVLSAVALYTFSGLFHGLRHETENAKRIWQLLDQSAIFWLIVGSNVPLAAYLLSPTFRNLQLGGMVLLAAAGTACLWLLPKPPHLLLIGLYVGLGVTSWIPIRHYARLLGWRGLFWIVLLSACYIGGAAIEAIKWPTLVPDVIGPHELLHFGDVLGTAAHLTLVVKYVLPRARCVDPMVD